MTPAQVGRDVNVLLLADLNEPLGPAACRADAVLAWEVATALAALQRDVGGLTVDLVARRGSAPVLPTITADPDELAPPGPPAAVDARQDALYTQMVLSGVADGYDVIHSLVPLVAPTQVLVSRGSRICQTVTVPPTHLSVALARLVPPDRLHHVGLGLQGPDPLAAAPPPIDVTRFALDDGERDPYAVWDGEGGGDALVVAREAAAAAGLAMRVLGDGDPAELLRRARVLLHTPYPPRPVGVVWPLRALACGTPVVSWDDPVLQRYCDAPGRATFVATGDAGAMADGIGRVAGEQRGADRRADRRACVVAWSGHRAVAARYREIYRHVAGLG